MNSRTKFVFIVLFVTFLIAQVFNLLQNYKIEKSLRLRSEDFNSETVYNVIESYFNENTFEVVE